MASTIARALIADDDPGLRSLLGSALRRDGFEVVEAQDGRELLTLLKEISAAEAAHRPTWRPDIIISDVKMPAVSGLAVLATMRRMHLDIPMILITAFGDAETHALAQKNGVSAIIDKPFDLYELRRLILDTLKIPHKDAPAGET